MVVDSHVAVISENHPMRVALLDPAYQNHMRHRPDLTYKLARGVGLTIEQYLKGTTKDEVEFILGHYPVGGSLLETCKEMNDNLAAIMKEYPGRFYGMAMVPLPDPKAAVQELRRAVQELGFKGAFIYTLYVQIPYDSPNMIPICEEAANLRVPILLHTALVPAHYDPTYPLNMTMDNMFRILKSGILQKVPDVKLVLGHLGGGLIFYKDLFAKWEEDVRAFFGPEYGADFEKLYFDIAPGHLWSERIIKMSLDLVGEDRLLFGTNYPLFKGPEGAKDSVKYVQSLSLPASTKEKILSLNAKRLFRL